MYVLKFSDKRTVHKITFEDYEALLAIVQSLLLSKISFMIECKK